MSMIANLMGRVRQPWTLQRALYVLLGLWTSAQAFNDGQWSWLAFGLYFASMGIFSFGCAAGCAVPMTSSRSDGDELHYHEFQVVDSKDLAEPNHRLGSAKAD